jgi:hypothetical protein
VKSYAESICLDLRIITLPKPPKDGIVAQGIAKNEIRKNIFKTVAGALMM